jgi:hypothetical protein
MKDTEKGLKEALGYYFTGHGQRRTMMTKLVLAILQMSTVNYAKLALVINAQVKTSSNFKRIQRFMKSYCFDQGKFVQFAWDRYSNQGNWIALSMDRTNWKFGRHNINILTIGISWRGTAIPLVWKLLDKRGNSNTEERINLLDELLELIPDGGRQKIRYLLMDREFGSRGWIAALKDRRLGFIVRIRVDAKVRKPGQERERSAKRLFACSHFRCLRKQRVVFHHRLFLGGYQLNAKEYLILASDTPLKHQGRMYAERWGIEVFFGSCKRRGFNFEDTHLTKMDRINTLIYLLGITFIWAFKTGEMEVRATGRITVKYVKERRTKLFSIFRVGMDRLRHKMLNHLRMEPEIDFLSCI